MIFSAPDAPLLFTLPLPCFVIKKKNKAIGQEVKQKKNKTKAKGSGGGLQIRIKTGH
jgi:hypothetical protein